jgi:beta-glucosidase
VAVVGPNGDSVYEDWYSGTLPYAVTVRQGITERLGSDAVVTFAEGVDRIALRRAADDACLMVSPGHDGAELLAAPAPDPRTAQFDLFDWGHGVCALRAVANGRYVTVNDAGVLVSTATQPNGWVVRETFTLEPRGDEVVLRHLATGTYVAVDDTGVARADAAAHEATGFVVERAVSGVKEAVAAAREADVAVVVLGNHPLINGRETEDRVDLALPPAQEELLHAVHAVNPNTVLLVTSSYPYAIGWADAHVPAILWSAHGGQEFGHAFAEVLFGDTAPAGRLTQTWYRSAADLPDLFDYDIIAADATYLYFRGAPLFAFGHGLTYPDFEYSDVRLSADRVDPDGVVTVSVDVLNTGDVDSDEVVQLYTRQRRSRVKQPLRQLRGFERVRVPAGGRAMVNFQLRAADLAFWDVVGERYVVEAARHDVLIGRSSADIRLTTTLEVSGERVARRDPRRPLAAVNADGYADVHFVDATKPAGDAVMAALDGAWIVFEGVDFGAGVASCSAELSAVEHGTAEVRLRRDDPLDGQIIATLTVIGSGDRYVWTPTTAPAGGVTGVCDLYVVFESAGVCLRELTFEHGGA